MCACVYSGEGYIAAGVSRFGVLLPLSQCQLLFVCLTSIVRGNLVAEVSSQNLVQTTKQDINVRVNTLARREAHIARITTVSEVFWYMFAVFAWIKDIIR